MGVEGIQQDVMQAFQQISQNPQSAPEVVSGVAGKYFGQKGAEIAGGIAKQVMSQMG